MTKTVSPNIYSKEYYEQACQGYDLFFETQGQVLPKRLAMALDMASIQPGMTILDVGSGRGEVVLHAARREARAHGVDYAVAALRAASIILTQVSETLPIALHCSNAQQLPFANDVFDRVFMLDLVEHLYPQELNSALSEAHRVLKPDGRLIIHTMPNTWYYKFGYPLFRWFQRLRGRQLPADPRDRWKFVHQVHVNEQNLVSLRRALRQAGFQATVWLESAQDYSKEGNRVVQFLMQASTRLYPFRWVFCNDLFAVARKAESE